MILTHAMTIADAALARFLRYVQIDTQSDPNSPTVPSTKKQKNLGRMLVQELRAMGIADAELDEKGYVYAHIEATLGCETAPAICFCAHMDTSPDCSGTGVKPIVHENYQGQDVVMPDDTSIFLSPRDEPHLLKKTGHRLVTASGTTLLGADNKAGVAEIMTIAEELMKGEIQHGRVCLLFTPDEEIGRGADHVDLEKLGADFGYTFDGEEVGTLEDETWNAQGATLTITGISAHPGMAKGKMVNALKVASYIVNALPHDQSPEGTEGREGFIHPTQMSGGQEQASVGFILRDFTKEGLEEKAVFLNKLTGEVEAKFVGAKIEIEIKDQYQNMKVVLDQHPEVTERAMAAMRTVGLKPERHSVRGGTDGARLSFMGLPCPNLFAGEHAFHGKTEWVTAEDMEMAVRVGLEIVRFEL